MFDTLTYEKGASVLRMLERFLGEDSFRSGIRRYLKEARRAKALGSAGYAYADEHALGALKSVGVACRHVRQHPIAVNG